MARGRKWDSKELDIMLSLKPRGHTAQQIQEELERNGFRRSITAIRNKLHDLGKAKTRPVVIPEMNSDETAINAVTEMRDIATLGITKWHEMNVHRDLDQHTKVLSISDLHIPFFYEDVIDDALDRHADADIVVLNGDILEVDTASRFPRHKTVLLKYEYKLALELIVRLAKRFPKVVLVKGNHEARLDRYFQDRIEPGLNMMVEGDILWRLSEGYGFDEAGNFQRHFDLPNVSYDRGLTNWFVQIGQAIFCHPWRTSSVSIKSVELAQQWFMERGYSYQAIVMGHTHRLGSAVTAGKLLIEQGCTCVPLDYAARADIKYRPTSFGYAVVVMDEHGNVDFNQSRPYYYGTGSTTPCHKVER